MFVDHAKIHVKAGDGGDGCLAFRREKFVPRGGPSGGDGGKGGDVYIRSNPHVNTLLSLRYQQHFKAERGSHGEGSNRHGKNGADVVIDVPVGTVVIDAETEEVIVDLTEPDEQQLVARGGLGGRGNAAFATSTNQAPRKVEPGRSGEERVLRLELKVLADAGLIGFPNAGKSTLISVISAARPKIADYPFTTLSPNLGVVFLGEFRTVVVADIPGLIEGAHGGSGLGDQFLRHIERCKLLLHLVDVSGMGPEDPAIALEVINHELAAYSDSLREKPQIVVASKCDAADPVRLDRLEAYCESRSLELLQISAVSGSGIARFKSRLARHFDPEVQ